MSRFLNRLSGEKKKSNSQDSHTGSDWTKASDNLGVLASGYANGYTELTAELNTHRRGEGFDLWWRTQGNEIIAIIVDQAPKFNDVQMVKGHIGSRRINVADSSNEDKSKTFWKHLKSLVQPQSEEGDWKADW